jgi:hypothetical protein
VNVLATPRAAGLRIGANSAKILQADFASSLVQLALWRWELIFQPKDFATARATGLCIRTSSFKLSARDCALEQTCLSSSKHVTEE